MTIEFSKPAAEGEVTLPSLVVSVDSASIRDYLALTEKVPALLVFVHPQDPTSAKLLATITGIVERLSGSILALVIDAVKSPELSQAFDLAQVPSVFGLLNGQPAPLFSGDQPEQQVQMVIARVLEVAKQNGLTAKANVSKTDPEPELSASVRAAHDAIDAGNYKEALGLFEKALLENPNDTMAEAGRAQVKLLLRLEDKNLAALIASTPASVDQKLERADALIATGDAEAGFETLLKVFEQTPKEQREPIRLRLVELFLVVGADNPVVGKARRSLSLLLF